MNYEVKRLNWILGKVRECNLQFSLKRIYMLNQVNKIKLIFVNQSLIYTVIYDFLFT